MSRPVRAYGSRPIAGGRLDRWVWGRARRDWIARLVPAMCAFRGLPELRASALWRREGARVERFLARIQAGRPGEGRGPAARKGRGPCPREECGPAVRKEAGRVAPPVDDAAPEGAPLPARPLRHGDMPEGAQPSSPSTTRLRFVHWNILKGVDLAGIYAWLEQDPRLARPDVLLLSEADVGMARSANLHAAAEIAARLGMHWAFAPNYLELTKGPDPDALAPGENVIGLHGVAILSRRAPLALARAPLPECFDMFAFHEKRYGGRAALFASFPGGLIAACAHLEVRHSAACRAGQMRVLLEALDAFVEEEARAGRPARLVVLGGDWNTHTFRRGRLGGSLLGMARILTHSRRSLERQLMEPWRARREPLFTELERRGYAWKELNDRRATACEVLGNVEELHLLSGPLRGLAARLLGLGARRIAMRLDWFAARPLPAGLRPAAVTAGELRPDHRPSDHLPIALDISAPF